MLQYNGGFLPGFTLLPLRDLTLENPFNTMSLVFVPTANVPT